jgi:hypothetical protein
LHGECEVGESGGARERLADQAQRADVQLVEIAAIGLGHRVFQPAGIAQHLHEARGERVDVALVMLVRRDLLRRPRVEPSCERAMRVVEERPGEERAVGHQFPSKTGFCLAANAR